MKENTSAPAPWSRTLGQFLTNLLLGGNLVTLFLLWVCCATTWVDAVYHPHLAVVGLVFPVILLLNLLFLPLWLFFKPRYIVVPLLGMVLCGGYILDYCPVNFTGKESDADLTVLSWNTCYLNYEGKESVQSGADYLLQSDADLICLQETPSVKSGLMGEVCDTFRARGYYVESQSLRCVISRYPLLHFEHIPVLGMKHSAIERMEVVVGGDTVAVFNIHLECNKLSIDDRDEYGDVFRSHDTGAIRGEVRFLARKLAEAARLRGLQVKRLSECLDSVPEGQPVLICGDFNDTPISYAYQHMARRLNSAYRHGGTGTGFSYRDRRFPVRIDHVFYSKHWQCLTARFDPPVAASDHLPLIVRLRKRQK